MSNVKVQMKPKAQSGKRIPLDFIAKEKNILTFSHLSFI
jgi:hypothetical protein